MDKKLIVANWKMYLTLSQSIALAKRISKSKFLISKIELVLCPSFLAMEEVAKVIKKTPIKLGAQDVEPEKRGAFTGAVGLDDLAEVGVEYVLVGHSERRQYQGETDELTNKKLRAVLKAGMKPILCVGEPSRSPTTRTTPNPSLEMRGNVAAQKYVAKQLRLGLQGVAPKDLQRVIVAYEPIWAIGTGRPASPKDASAMHKHIKNLVGKVSVLYGGSVNRENASAFLKTKGVDGLLVGGASTKAEELKRIISSC